MNSRISRSLVFSFLLLGFIYYAWQYILATSFLVGGTRYFILFDDAMISMRYAYNLAHGNGLVWNVGERVEGFTNPLWVFYMALLHLLPIPPASLSLVVQITGAACLAANLYFVWRIVEFLTDDLLAMLGAVAFTAFYAPLNSFGLLGMEVSLLALILSGCVWLILKNGKERYSVWLWILLSVTTLLRTDMVVPYVIILCAMCLLQRQHRTRHLLWGLGLLILFVGGQRLGAYIYYGQWLPNTYYLKVEGWPFALRVLRGAYALFWFVYFTNWVLFVLPLATLFFRRDWKVVLLLAILLGQLAYSVYVGGDAWEEHGGANRYIVIAMPLFFASFVLALEVLRQRASMAFQATRFAENSSRLVWAGIVAFAMLNFNLLLGDWKSIERWQLSRRPDYVAGSDRNLGIALALQTILKPGASIAVVGAGTIPYLLPDHPVFDILGKSDPIIAHELVRTPMSLEDIPNMRPGHMKWDYAHSFDERKPDVIVAIWPGTEEEAAPYLENYEYAGIAPRIKVYLRKDSQLILWDRISVSN